MDRTTRPARPKTHPKGASCCRQATREVAPDWGTGSGGRVHECARPSTKNYLIATTYGTLLCSEAFMICFGAYAGKMAGADKKGHTVRSRCANVV